MGVQPARMGLQAGRMGEACSLRAAARSPRQATPRRQVTGHSIGESREKAAGLFALLPATSALVVDP